MAEYAYDLNPVQHIIADAVGEPGKRTFFLQARAGTQLVSLVMEKQEVASLAMSGLQLLEELQEKFPHLAAVRKPGKVLYPEQPLEPIFRVGQLILGYDEREDMIWIIAKALMVTEEGTVIDPESDEVPAVRFVTTRAQLKALCDHALEVVAKGRPTCPLCGRPIDREGHFCPRSDGHARPIVL